MNALLHSITNQDLLKMDSASAATVFGFPVETGKV